MQRVMAGVGQAVGGARGDDRLDDFIQDFPSVSRDQAVAVLERARMSLTGEQDEAAAAAL